MTEMEIPVRRDLPAEWVQRQKEHLLIEFARQERSRSRRRRRLVLVALPAIVAVLAATGFTSYVLTREPTQLESIGCFETASLRGNTAIVDADGRDPVAICTELWREGLIGTAPVPRRLTACVLASGAIGVFPSTGADTCAKLGIAPLPLGYSAEAERFAKLRHAIVARLGEPASGSSRGSPKCVHEQDARAIVRRELDAHGYRDWRIDVAGEGFTAERPCAEVAFEGNRKAVILVPVWR